MSATRVTFNGEAHYVSPTAARYIASYLAKREVAPTIRKARPVQLMAARPAPVKMALPDGSSVIGKIYKRCAWGKHESCPGSFESHSICTCDCHPR